MLRTSAVGRKHIDGEEQRRMGDEFRGDVERRATGDVDELGGRGCRIHEANVPHRHHAH